MMKIISGRIGFLLCVTACIVLLLVVKYQLDVSRDREHYKLKASYEDRNAGY